MAKSDSAEVDYLTASAYHEAAHAVVAMLQGWDIAPGGITLEPSITHLRRPAFVDLDERPNVMVSLAGWLAEHRLHGQGERGADLESLEYLVDAARDDWAEELDDAGDLGDVAKHLVRLTPDITAAVALERVRFYEAAVWELLAMPEVWRQVEAVALAVLQNGTLSGDAIHALTGHEPRMRK